MHREIAMEEEIISLASKSYMRHLVAQTNEYPSFYKYCDFDGGIAMLSAMNIQFTRADSLNDDDEVNISKCNIEPHIQLLRDAGIPEDIISKKFDEAQSFFSGIGICSCGKQPTMINSGKIMRRKMIAKMECVLNLIKI